ncbi:hypothetical protein BDZ91DRAFT_734048 [Kalaharituber pfeilii]|nr:hypothetical protein BDZ91DRAFT_734048 [Kalaharituber pfeilii]
MEQHQIALSYKNWGTEKTTPPLSERQALAKIHQALITSRAACNSKQGWLEAGAAANDQSFASNNGITNNHSNSCIAVMNFDPNNQSVPQSTATSDSSILRIHRRDYLCLIQDTLNNLMGPRILLALDPVNGADTYRQREPEGPPPFQHPPLPSPKDLYSYLNQMLSCYPICQEIFMHLGTRDVFNLMLLSKAMYEILGSDKALKRLIAEHLVEQRSPPKIGVKCDWCSQKGCECAKCKIWEHTDYSVLAKRPRVHIPQHRLATLCPDCSLKLPAFSFHGRCLCNTSNARPLCNGCREDEQYSLWKAGLKFEHMFEKPIPCEVLQPQKCDGIDQTGCGKVVHEEDLRTRRSVRCCIWCGLVAVEKVNKS